MRILILLLTVAPLVFCSDSEDSDEHSRDVLGSTDDRREKLDERVRSIFAKVNSTLNNIESGGRAPNPFAILSALPGILSVGMSITPSDVESAEGNTKKHPMRSMMDPMSSLMSPMSSMFRDMKRIRASGNEMLQGPHICVREVNKEISKDDHLHETEQKCTLFSQAKVCVQNIYLKEIATETTKIQECCEGYGTHNIEEDGCNQVESQQTLAEVFVKFSDVKPETWNRTLSNNNNTIIITDSDSVIVLEGEKRRNYEWKEGEVLQEETDKYVVMPSKGSHNFRINCVEEKVGNIRVPEGLVHVFENKINPAKESVLKALEEDGRFKTFLSILSEPIRQLLALTSKQSTVFAFTDERFEQYPDELKEQIRKQSGCYKGLDEAHLIKGSWCSAKDSSLVAAIKKKGYSYKSNSTGNFINDVKVLDYDNFALNGRLVVVDGILNRNELITWQENLRAVNAPMAESLSNFTLPSDELVTVFVPPAKINEEYQFTEEFSKNHIVTGEILTVEKLPRSIETLAGAKIFTSRKEDTGSIFVRKPTTVQIGCSRILVDKSVHSCNSVIHFISKPLPLIRYSISSLLESKENLQKFKQLWNASHKNNETEAGPLTLFVPVDDAFSVNGFRRMAADMVGVRNFVLRHSSEELICEHDLDHSEEIRVRFIPTRTTMSLAAKTLDGEIFIEGAKVMDTFVVSDGIVHVIDSIITKKEGTSIHPSADKRKLPFDSPFSTLLGLFGGLPRAA